MSLDRRKFLKRGAILGASLPVLPSLANSASIKAEKINSGLVKNGTIITAAHWGILKLSIKDGVVVKSEPFEKITKMDNPLQHYTPDMIYKSRVRFPYVRKSYLENPDNPKRELRGKEEFVRVSYKQAIELIAKELKKTRDSKGASAIFGGSYGWKSSGNMQNSRILLHRFLNVTGGFTGVTGDYSTGASQIIMPYVVGSIEVYEQQTSWENILEESKVVVIWGADPLATLRISWTSTEQEGLKYFEALKERKIKVICIDPVRTETIKFLNAQWVAPRPNTDVAMMLGMASHLIAVGKVNYEFLENYTTGFDKFKTYLDGKEDGIKKDTKWASKICGISEKNIKSLAELFYDNTTMIMSGWGMQRAHHGEQPHWMLVTLASMIGQIGTKGGGFGLSYHYSNGGVPTCKGGIIGGITAGSVGIWKNGKFKGMPKAEASLGGAEWLQNAASYSFPLARVAEAFLNPGKKIQHNGEELTYPEMDFIYWAGGNPLVHHQDTNTNLKAWRVPRTVVVNEIYWTPTAKMADIVMPATSPYERDDLTMAGDYSNQYIVPMKKAVEPIDESRDDYEIFADLCKVYGKDVYNAFTDNGKKAMDFIKEHYNSALRQTRAYGAEFATPMPEFEEFWAKNEPVKFEANVESLEWVRFAEFIEDPILNALGTESGLIEIYSESIEKYNYDDCKPHPTWFEPIEWLGNADKNAPFHLLTNHPINRLHSQMCHTSLREKYAVGGREPILINSKDAKKLGVKNGDIVRVFNKRGEVLAGAVVSSDIMQGVVRLCEGGWYDPDENGLCKYGSANVLTIDIPTSKLANGNISHTGLVNIEKFKGTLPEVTAFSAPKGCL
ncbi:MULTISPECIES: molybdopterin guanine dinucleotide-containing S/N-oxide reductase [unclassified Campylobacter]|uniref:molybdopterin guanine dinucleotide-containing S/N-oxide reductase n=1 Tax=unclassified Campylobacter TaxID=2593542 RepID=UPI001237F08D|nr:MULTISPECIES: molybdopterin guanine dinucleotide-containing S/N-oxide reductase [unclassified Campylobacter]KAA6225208.1 molybdopterin guanine dinucleotide-containing S/N-oxide reductase [Campylobacter sp. LR196d]KAA6228979.1 molybdopterin guanine dinucleotide-containing S/N-oxide reductase [Campylobacter sp. LR286c]KAA6231633.1 molybdopterin guanine dinucleotide-containing S/N-oxide reductase [Campylobacter sp. LR291e]